MQNVNYEHNEFAVNHLTSQLLLMDNHLKYLRIESILIDSKIRNVCNVLSRYSLRKYIPTRLQHTSIMPFHRRKKSQKGFRKTWKNKFTASRVI